MDSLIRNVIVTLKKGEGRTIKAGGAWIYDNEIDFFWDEFSAGSATVNYTFRAVRRGVYPVPPVQAECMYEPEVFGRSYGYLSEIR